MRDGDTFVTILYVMSDDFCQSQFPEEQGRPGPQAALSLAEVITLAIFGQWVNFPSERAFYRYAERHLRTAFPALPHRAQFNRLMRTHREAITAFGSHLVQALQTQRCDYEALDSTAAVTRDAK
ncbi:hypothetical protein EPA93_45215 [Ktedonosporobacter rubrisoli]|uniref:Transposase n=1 Tax=Ktedonosporobacter rubrisoli TaxID=2509675 RepID=A0A4P6K5G7_KTERU|nr:hypothetical protein [Ktedonosporobacter rubrisoli]QBD82786.1 hypothetical protein EPA93_45215 [Ktedonosporobacter rubrisoli]